MTDKEFLHQLRRGIGSAIVELKQSDNREKYKEIVYSCCLKDIGYDNQCEGTKGYYLYSAIVALGCEEEFLHTIKDVYMKRLPYWFMQQLTDILLLYASDGFSKATSILRDKYSQLKERLMKQKGFPYRYCEREQFEVLMTTLIHLEKWKSFKQCVDDAGAIILARKDDRCAYYDWFLGCAETQFGKIKVWKYLNAASTQSEYMRIFVTEYQKTENTGKEYQANLQPVTLAFLLDEVRKYSPGLGPYGLIGYCMSFVRTAGEEELINLARYIEAEDNDYVKTQLLRVFRKVNYPLKKEYLIDLAHSNNPELREAAIYALVRFKDEQIHDLAVELLESGETEFGLSLLKKNWKKSDDPLIRNVVMKSQRVSHPMQMDLRNIYSNHKLAACEEVLSHAYRNGDCSFCRSKIVHAMGKNGCLSDEILIECQYDSYDMTREYANRMLGNRKDAAAKLLEKALDAVLKA